MADKSRKKILYIITKSAWGGAGKYVYDLAANLPKNEFSAQGGPASGWEFIERDAVLALANLPTRNELLGRLVGSIASSMASFVRVLDKIKENKEKN